MFNFLTKIRKKQPIMSELEIIASENEVTCDYIMDEFIIDGIYEEPKLYSFVTENTVTFVDFSRVL